MINSYSLFRTASPNSDSVYFSSLISWFHLSLLSHPISTNIQTFTQITCTTSLSFLTPGNPFWYFPKRTHLHFLRLCSFIYFLTWGVSFCLCRFDFSHIVPPLCCIHNFVKHQSCTIALSVCTYVLDYNRLIEDKNKVKFTSELLIPNGAPSL